MHPVETAPRDESTGLFGSRAEFASSLSRRLESILGALSALEQQPDSVGRRDNFLRRVHALGASARVLGFAAAAEIFGRAEQQIRTSQVDTLADDISAVRKYLSDLPALVLRGAYSLAPPGRPASAAPSAPPLISEPLAVVAWGTPDFLAVLRSLDKAASSLELTSVADPKKLRETCIALGPDILLLDANRGSITLLVDELAQAPELASVAIVVANVPEEAAPGLLELGARTVLPARCTEQQLARALVQASHVPFERAPIPSPIGEVTLKDLAERLAQEIREGLVDAAVPSAQVERIDLGEGTPIRAALWSALAQIREHVVETSQGRVEFIAGPEGSVPLAPRASGYARGRGRTNVDSVDLSGRRILVVDDDPAVAWFVGGTLRAAGAVVTEANDGAQALEIACRLWPELIVSDVMMPGLDGFALCHAVKRDVLLRDVPIVLLSWKEDLLFRLRDLGADADGYLRKEASASTIVRRVRELLLSRSALEHRLSSDRETRGRLDGTTVRLLLELAAGLDRPVRIAMRDASALYDIHLRHGSIAAVTRTRHDGTVEHGQSVLSAMLGITAGRFSVVTDRDPCESMFSGSLQEILGPSVLRARAAQRVLSGLRLGLVDCLTLEPDAFGSDLPLLPMSLRPIADELLRGTAPRRLLASGVASVQLLESLLSDVARRGAVRAIADAQGEDLLEQEILALSSKPSVVPPRPAPLPPPLFTFQLSPIAPEALEGRTDDIHAPTSPTPTLAPAVDSALEWHGKPSPNQERDVAWESPSGTLSGVGRGATLDEEVPKGAAPSAQPSVSDKPVAGLSMPVVGRALPASNAPPVDDVDWAMEFSWDSTPPPAGSNKKGVSETSDTRPVTSGGFMRPAIATLERRALQVTPDLANAVVQAVSEATPPPVKSTETGPAPPSRAASTLSVPGDAALSLQTAGSTAADTSASRPPERLPREGTPGVRTAQAATADQRPGQNQVSTAVAGGVAIDRAGIVESPAVLPVVHLPPRPKLEPAAAKPQEPFLPVDRDGEDPVFPLVSTANVGIEVQPSIDVRATSGQPVFETLPPSALTPIEPKSVDNRDIAPVEPKSVENRDTLRSPEDSQREVATPLYESAVSVPPRLEQHDDSLGTSTFPAASDEPSRPTSPERVPTVASAAGAAKVPSSAPVTQPQRPIPLVARKVETQQPRPVGWIQALGLAALAGIVTFAVTVPIASFIRKRQEPVHTGPPVAAETLASSATSEPAEVASESTLSPMVASTGSDSAQKAADAPSASAQPDAATKVEEIPVPTDVVLQPGQALVEVTTGGGHAIFLDDAFVGRGPVRVITVQPGRHIVRTRLNGVERSDPIEVGVGRSLRLSLEQAWK